MTPVYHPGTRQEPQPLYKKRPGFWLNDETITCSGDTREAGKGQMRTSNK